MSSDIDNDKESNGNLKLIESEINSDDFMMMSLAVINPFNFISQKLIKIRGKFLMISDEIVRSIDNMLRKKIIKVKTTELQTDLSAILQLSNPVTPLLIETMIGYPMKNLFSTPNTKIVNKAMERYGE